VSDVKALIAAAQLPEREVPVCLRADLFARMEGLSRQLAEAESRRELANESLASVSPSRELATQLDALRQEMLEHTLTFHLRALPRRKFRAMGLEFPPRPSNAFDAMKGMNIEAAAEALVRRCLVTPVLDEEDWAALDEKLSDGQWQELANAAWAINDRDVEVPFLRTASRILQTSDDG
jgi:hypothetical protein